MSRYLLGLVCASLLSSTSALAQADVVKLGVPIAGVTPPGLRLLRVAAPPLPDGPVRASFGRAGTDGASVVVTVTVADSAAEAVEALARWRHRASRELPRINRLGDAAYGTPTHLGFVRNNVAVTIRRVRGSEPVIVLAQAAVVAVDRAPAVGARVRTPAVPRPGALSPTEQVAIRLPEQALAMDLAASGAAEARRTAEGWSLARTSGGAATVTVTVVDRFLRVHARQWTW